MIKRTLFLGKPLRLSTRHRQLVLRDETKETSQPIEDIGWVVIEHPQISITMPTMQALLAHNVSVIFCDEKVMPAGMLLPFEGHYSQSARYQAQIAAGKSTKKKLWQQTIRAKLNNQAGLLKKLGMIETPLLRYARQVLSGDSSNQEGLGAKYYWSQLFQESNIDWKRARYGEAPNQLLNYGYAILRSCAARAIVGVGLLPALGIHHHNKYNAFPLADDLMEPYRPFVDMLVYEWVMEHGLDESLSTPAKAHLLRLAQLDTKWDDGTRPLMNSLRKTASQLAQCFLGERRSVRYPKL